MNIIYCRGEADAKGAAEESCSSQMLEGVVGSQKRVPRRSGKELQARCIPFAWATHNSNKLLVVS
jgi:hypothetical protein